MNSSVSRRVRRKLHLGRDFAVSAQKRFPRITSENTRISKYVFRFPTLRSSFLFVSPGQLGLSLDDKSGCLQGYNCWTGVYTDRETNEILHLDTGARAFLSPGTAAADSRPECLRWWAKEDLLYLADCDDRPFRWPGAGSELRRDPAQAGKLAGFSVAKLASDHGERPAYRNSTHFNRTHLVRDPFGFLFPGCMYMLSMRQGSLHQTGNIHETRVVVNRDGTVTDGNGGQPVARWSFLEEQSLFGVSHDCWPSGDSIVLLVDNDHRQVHASFYVFFLFLRRLPVTNLCVHHNLAAN